MRHLEFVSCPANPDVWIRPRIHSNGTEYYKYLLIYTDDALCISDKSEHVLQKKIGRYFPLNEASIGPPKIYLGGHVGKVQLKNGVE